MQQQKLHLHGHHGSKTGARDSSGHIGSREGRNGSTTLNNNSSLHRFSVDALAGTASSASNNAKTAHLLNVTSDEDGSLTSWDDDVPVDDDDDFDDGPLSPTAVSTTSESSRGSRGDRDLSTCGSREKRSENNKRDK